MEECANGELPLHPHAASSSGFTYAEYWQSLTASAPALQAPLVRHANKRASVFGDGQMKSPIEKPASDSPTPPRLIHAATSAYRLRLSLSPNVQSAASSPSPKKSSDQQSKLSGSVRAWHTRDTSQMRTTTSHDTGEKTFGRGTSAHTEPEAIAQHLLPTSVEGEGKFVPISPPLSEVAPQPTHTSASSSLSSNSPRLWSSGDAVPTSVTKSPTSLGGSEDYATDAQVMQSARCYEEWRRCLCRVDEVEDFRKQRRALETHTPPTFQSLTTETARLREELTQDSEGVTESRNNAAIASSAPVGQSGNSSNHCERDDPSMTAQGLASTEAPVPVEDHFSIEAPSPPLRRHLRPTRHVARSSLSPIEAAAGAKNGDSGTHSKSRSVHSNDTHGLTTVKTDTKILNREGSDEDSLEAPATLRQADAAYSHSPRLAWTPSTSPEIRLPSVPEGSARGEKRSFLHDASSAAATQEKPAEVCFTQTTRLSNNKPTAKSKGSISSSYAKLLALAAHDKRALSHLTMQAAPSPPGPVQRQLFVSSDDDDADADADTLEQTTQRPEAPKGSVGGRTLSAEEPGLHQPTPLEDHKDIIFNETVHAATQNPPAETLIELSYISSDSSVDGSKKEFTYDAEAESEAIHSAIATEDYATSFVELGDDPEFATAATTTKELKSKSEEEEQPSPAPIRRVRKASLLPESEHAELGFFASDVEKGAAPQAEEQQNRKTEHPDSRKTLLAKHHKAVAALYADRLLESEVRNEELQLFLCWAQEKAERRSSCWQEGTQESLLSFVDVVDSAARASAMRADLKPQAAVKAIFRSAYANPRKPRPPCLHTAVTTSSSTAESSAQPLQPAVYVAFPAKGEGATLSNAKEDGKWLTPTSVNSRFINWIASDVDVYEGLLM